MGTDFHDEVIMEVEIIKNYEANIDYLFGNAVSGFCRA